MMTSSDSGVLDANILVYAANADDPPILCRAPINRSRPRRKAFLYVTSQVLGEFCATVTNRRRVMVPRSAAEALDAISGLLALPGIQVLPMW
jgi:predicted nucleic acid-binding protein